MPEEERTTRKGDWRHQTT